MPSRWVTESWSETEGTLDPDWILAHPPATPFTLLHGEGRFVVLAEAPLAHLGPADLPDLHWERRGKAPGLRPDLLGFVTYETGYGLDASLPPPPLVQDLLPDLRFTIHSRVAVGDRRTGHVYRALRTLPSEVEVEPPVLGRGTFRARLAAGTDTPAEYAAKVERIREEIARGQVYQANLSRQETWAVEGDLASLARRLLAANPAPFSALVADPAFTVLSTSPESFLQWRGGVLHTRPIKGTAPRHADPARDEALARALLASDKNRSELAMIVDLLRNDLARLHPGASVQVTDFPRLESFANVHHLVADLSMPLPAEFHLESLLAALFPGGSVTGCPKLAAMSLLRELEPKPRRIYCGALGWMTHDLSEGEWALPIRTAWASEGLLRFGVGGGVVWDSDPHDEYEETVHKGRSLVQCLSS